MVHEYTLITRYVVLLLLYVHMYEHTPNTFSREASTFFRLDRKEQSTLQDYHRGLQQEHVAIHLNEDTLDVCFIRHVFDVFRSSGKRLTYAVLCEEKRMKIIKIGLLTLLHTAVYEKTLKRV